MPCLLFTWNPTISSTQHQLHCPARVCDVLSPRRRLKSDILIQVIKSQTLASRFLLLLLSLRGISSRFQLLFLDSRRLSQVSVSGNTFTMGPRWKGKGSATKALEQPMSGIISDLQSLLIQSNSIGLLSGCNVLIEANPQQTHLLNLACFGRSIPTPQNENKQCFQLGLEEAYFLYYSLKCLQILMPDGSTKPENEIWNYMCLKLQSFPELYKAYSHLRLKNWVVRPGSQYGVDYVAYRHHPALVHSEFAVLVLSDDESSANGRLRVWSDLHCTLRLCGSVAKTLLVIRIIRMNQNNKRDLDFPSCLDESSVIERTVTRWNPERSREESTDIKCNDKHILIDT